MLGEKLEDEQAQQLKELAELSKVSTSVDPMDTTNPGTSGVDDAFSSAVKTVDDLDSLLLSRQASKRKGNFSITFLLIKRHLLAIESIGSVIENEHNFEMSEESIAGENFWTESDVDFSNIPLGLMPYQTSESLYLKIDTSGN